MPSPKQLLQAIQDQRAELQGALHHVHERWDTKPAGGEGEDAWCPREVAQHVIGAESFFTNMIVQACGYPAQERPILDVSTPALAATALARVGVTTDSLLRHVQEAELEKSFEHPRMGVLTVQRMMEMIASHGKEHTESLLAAGQKNDA